MLLFSVCNSLIQVKIVPLDVRKSDQLIFDDDSDSDGEDDFDERKITVPLTVTMIVIGGYIFGGAVLFGLWEGWDWLQSAYFCFITLSTIGFGDVVPGTDFENPQAQAQLLLGAVYVLFGMAILSMCFSLMQQEILAKARWVGQKLGIIEKESEE